MRKNSVCFGCTERVAGCHGKCERYQEEKKTRDAENLIIGKVLRSDNDVTEVLLRDYKPYKMRR